MADDDKAKYEASTQGKILELCSPSSSLYSGKSEAEIKDFMKEALDRLIQSGCDINKRLPLPNPEEKDQLK